VNLQLPSNYGTRYLKAPEFVDLCKNLGIEGVSTDRLQWLERKKLFFPKLRVTIDAEYAKLRSDFEENPDNPHFGKGSFELPNYLLDENKFVERIRNWESIWGYHEFFHPLDKKTSRKRVSVPSQSEFREWDSYRVSAGQIRGHDRYTDTAIHFYSSLQAFQLFEVLEALKITILIDTSDAEAVKSVWQQQIPMDKVVSMTLPFHFDPNRSVFAAYSVELDALSFYWQHYERVSSVVIVLWRDEHAADGQLAPNAEERYRRHLKRIATLTVRRFALDLDRLIELSKELCRRYFDYEEQKEEKLKTAVKREIRNLVWLIEDGFDLTTGQIIDRIGRATYNRRNTLDVIIPDIEKEARIEAKETIQSYLTRDTEISNHFLVSEDEINEFLLFLQFNGFGELPLAISEIRKDWYAMYGPAKLKFISHIKSISLLPESLMKLIGRRSPNDDTRIAFSSYIEFKKCLALFYGDEEWFGTLSGAWNITTIPPGADIEGLVNGNILGKRYCNSISGDFLVKAFLIVGVVRNATAHDASMLNGLSESTYVILLKNCIYASFFVWLVSARGNDRITRVAKE
jgi:hypothetical protein